MASFVYQVICTFVTTGGFLFFLIVRYAGNGRRDNNKQNRTNDDCCHTDEDAAHALVTVTASVNRVIFCAFPVPI